MVNTKEKSNYIFYVSEMEELPASGHFRKMDAGMEIVSQINKDLQDCKVMKYTEYGGEILDADSIGIVFPAHMWGISLAVYSFLQHLRFKTGTYIYAVAVGESLSGGVDSTIFSRVKILEQFKRAFVRRSVGCESDIFIRCIDMERTINCSDELIKDSTEISTNVKHILEGLLFYNVNRLISAKQDATYNKVTSIEKGSSEHGISVKIANTRRATSMGNGIRLSNVYLDEDIFAGVKLCQVM